MSALGYQVPPSSFFLSLCIRIFIFLLSLHIDYFSPTLGGLRLHSQEFRLIQNILVSIYLQFELCHHCSWSFSH